ncbi:MAG: hypothetical protein EP305_05115 [Bacteroidetes bacterium]|nr:MAG: hypothetical protein EP305_05115 [Bacteroidota bacterium]
MKVFVIIIKYLLILLGVSLPLIAAEIIMYDIPSNFSITGIISIFVFIGSLFYPILRIVQSTSEIFSTSINLELRLRKLIFTILLSIYVFTNQFFFYSVIKDLNDSFEKYNRYKILTSTNVLEKEKTLILETRNQMLDNRAFTGIEERIYSGVDYNKDVFNIWNQHEEFPIEKILENSKKEDFKVINPIHENFKPVYISCLLYSISVMTNTDTFGIAPNSWEVKLFTGLEKIFSLFFLVLVLGMIFSGWWTKNESR